VPSAGFDPFDPADLALSPEQLANITIVKAKTMPRKRAEPFIMRVPLRWMEQASRLPGRCIAVGLLLWFLAGRQKRRTVSFCLARGATLNVSEKATRAALRQLATAGLAIVTGKPGRGLEVTILDVNRGDES
jgi:hypothetical protein